MESLKKKRAYLIVLIVVITAVLAARPSDGSKQAQAKKDTRTQKHLENYAGPIVDYDSDNKISSVNRSPDIRKTKSRLYNNRAPQPFGEMASEGYDLHTHWNIGLPPLPVTESQVIAIGDVTDAAAFQSEDRTGVYSEFSIKIIDILKNKTAFPLTVGGLIVTGREGGVVRLKSGSLFLVRINDQGMPRVDRRYLFFLKYDNESQTYHIVTAYELKSERVIPLDGGDQFSAYRGQDVRAFLNLVHETVAQDR
ncbi:MAG TPA: hypothetical protein VN937_00470 [Blastocatellia bacterium]|nr:hypothetical protein [Blastocatellia bacterium]